MTAIPPTCLSPGTVASIRGRLARGMAVYRGLCSSGRPSDPGDFGRGTYYTTSFYRAECHGAVFQMRLRLKNPLVLTVEEAYREIADRFGTISGIAFEPGHGAGDMTPRAARSAEATAALQALGYDGVAVVTPRSCPGASEIEIVRFPGPTLAPLAPLPGTPDRMPQQVQ